MLIIWNPTNKQSKLRGQEAVIFFKVKDKIKQISQATKEYTVNLHSKLKRSMIISQLHRDGLVDEILLRVVIKKSQRSKTLRHNMDVHSSEHYPRHKENSDKENVDSTTEKENNNNNKNRNKKRKSKYKRKGKGRKSSSNNNNNNSNNNENSSGNEGENRNKRRRKTTKKKNFAFDEGMLLRQFVSILVFLSLDSFVFFKFFLSVF